MIGMKIEGMDWLHKIREDEYLDRRELSRDEQLHMMEDESEESIRKLGLKKVSLRKRR